MKRSPLAPLLLAALAGVALAGCDNGSVKPQVAFVSNNPAEFWSIAHAGANKAADEEDVDLHFRRPSTGTVADQKRIIDALLVRGVDAIAISVIDPKNQKYYLRRVAGRVPLIAVDNDAPESGRLCYLGTNNYKAGRAVGRLVKKVLPEGGTVAIFVGMIEPANALQRWKGVLHELGDISEPADVNDLDALRGEGTQEWYGNYKLYGVGPARLPFTDGANSKRAKERADDVLVQLQEDAKQGKLCMVGLWAYNPPAIYSAVKALGLDASTARRKGRPGHVHIVGFDEDEKTLLGIKDGDIFGTVVQDPYNFGFESVKLMAKLARGQAPILPADRMVYIDERVINRANVEAFHRKLNELTGKPVPRT